MLEAYKSTSCPSKRGCSGKMIKEFATKGGKKSKESASINGYHCVHLSKTSHFYGRDMKYVAAM